MNRPLLVLIGVVALAGLGMLVIPVPQPAPEFSRIASAPARVSDVPALRDIRWHELMPKDWDPHRQITDMQKEARIHWDGDPRAAGMLKKVHDLWDDAPVNPAMDGAEVRIPGYVVPLGESQRGLKEFLLVPYFGACIHSPPPPSNQIIHVVAREPVKGVRAMATVWIGGKLKVLRSGSSMGVSSYSMDAIQVEPYTVQRRE